jgi:ribosomal protein L29
MLNSALEPLDGLKIQNAALKTEIAEKDEMILHLQLKLKYSLKEGDLVNPETLEIVRKVIE